MLLSFIWTTTTAQPGHPVQKDRLDPSVNLSIQTTATAPPNRHVQEDRSGSSANLSGASADKNWQPKTNIPAALTTNTKQRSGMTLMGTGVIRYVKAGASGNGSDWTNASGDLQAMINVSVSGDMIYVAQGTYKPIRPYFNPTSSTTNPTDRLNSFVLKSGVEIFGGFPNVGNPVWGDRDWETYTTILSGDIGSSGVMTDNCYHVIISVKNNASTILDGFTVTGGYANLYGGHEVNGESIYGWNGGGIHISSSSPTLSNLIFDNNTAGIDGGGIFFDGSNSSMFNVTVSNNTTLNLVGAITINTDGSSDGAGISFWEGTFFAENLTVIGNRIGTNIYGRLRGAGAGIGVYEGTHLTLSGIVTINDNHTPYGSGGGIQINPNCTVIVKDGTTLTISGNSTGIFSGGGMGVGGHGGGGSFIVEDGTATVNVTNNISGTCGGGIVLDGAVAYFSGSTTIIKDNTASTCEAGGINAYLSSVTFSGETTIIEGNISNTFGGGMNIYDSSVTFSGETIIIKDNTAGAYGGGIGNYHSPVTFLGETTIINDNTSGDFGGGIVVDGGTIDFSSRTTTIKDNISNTFGGGISNYYGSITFSGDTTTIEGNTADDYGGGISLNGATIDFLSSMTIIKDNTAVTTCSGGINTFASSSITFSGDTTIVEGNTAGTYGGGITVDNGGNVAFSSETTIIKDNTASSRYGGGINTFASGSVTFSGETTIIEGNTSGDYGGGISLNGGAVDLSSRTTIIKDNTAVNRGGGICAIGDIIFSGETVFIENNSATATGSAGGGISVESGGSATNISGSTNSPRMYIRGNSAVMCGGGISSTGNALLTNAVIENNTTDAISSGSGIYAIGSYFILMNSFVRGNAPNSGIVSAGAGNLTLANVLISGNGGCGILNHSTGTVTLINITVAGNINGIYSISGTLNVRNSIIAGNLAGEVSVSGGAINYQYSLVQGLSSITGIGTTFADPMFIAPLAYSAPTIGGNYRLSTGSPAVDRGEDTIWNVNVTYQTATKPLYEWLGHSSLANAQTNALDLGGKKRFLGERIDMGTFEGEGLELALKVFLQGVIQSNGKMTTYIQEPDMTFINSVFLEPKLPTIPLLYSIGGVAGGGIVCNGINDVDIVDEVVDWIKVEIWDIDIAASTKTILEEKILLLRPDGSIVDIDGSTPVFYSQSQPVYAVVKQRNHLAVISKDPFDFSSGSYKEYNFGTEGALSINAFDVPIVTLHGLFCMWAGDFDDQGYVSVSDYNSTYSAYINGLYDEYIYPDINMNGYLDSRDLDLIRQNFMNSVYSTAVYFP